MERMEKMERKSAHNKLANGQFARVTMFNHKKTTMNDDDDDPKKQRRITFSNWISNKKQSKHIYLYQTPLPAVVATTTPTNQYDQFNNVSIKIESLKTYSLRVDNAINAISFWIHF